MVDTMNINEVLYAIQNELHMNRKRKNIHYDYAYVNVEDMMTVIKNALQKYQVALFFTQDIKEVANYLFLQIILTIRYKNHEIKSNYFCPIQAPSKQGESLIQSFGATIFYANRYALASMFLLDEGLDFHTLNKGKNSLQESGISHSNRQDIVHNANHFNYSLGKNAIKNRIGDDISS